MAVKFEAGVEDSTSGSGSSSDSHPVGAGIRILVVEDHADVAGTIAKSLRKKGYDVSIAADGMDGLRLAIQQEPKVVVVDLRLPKLSGSEVIRRLRLELSQVRIVAISGAADASEMEEAGRLGANLMLAKPFGPDRILDAVEELLFRGH
jgi:DNA-binding response OmpR family regulator